ncbi:esterase-like activity of phytase family protein [Jiella mangrovi]|uniref:Esterase-like activity of phytase family protein n=1 Tax=Jiella mangrovi TaxID=2821407 RepID=A0ABS4BB91_9HYPH|nr:esterase-like activity of phytase family protein [Jiella mangrovi]
MAAPVWPTGFGEPITIRCETIDRFRKNSNETRFGALTFLGGLQFSSSDGRVHGISALRLTDDGSAFLGVTDNGNWLAGEILRGQGGRPIGFAEATVAPLRDRLGGAIRGKALGDAESLAIDPTGRTAYVGFEQRHRISAYDLRHPGTGKALDVPLPMPVRELRANKGLEALAIAPAHSALAGSLVTVSEHSIDEDGNLFAGIVGKNGGRGSVFKVRRYAKWEVSDGDFLPGGDLLLLERRFEGLFGGLGIRIRKIAADAIRAGALVDGPVVFEADLSDEIDNMEGLDVWQDDRGRTRLTLVSDDNASFFQRNLLLEFVWSEDGPAASIIGQ